MWPPWLLVVDVVTAALLRHRSHDDHHPLVERALSDTRSGETLDAMREEVESARLRMEHWQTEAQSHMKEGLLFKEKAQQLEQVLKGQEDALIRIEEKKEQLTKIHEDVREKLTAAIEPKIERSTKFVEKTKKKLERLASERTQWENKVATLHAAAKKGLDVKRRKLAQYVNATEAVAEARRHVDEAAQDYRRLKIKTNGIIEAYRFADTQLDGALTRLEELERVVHDAQDARANLERVKRLENAKVTQALEAETARVSAREERVKNKEDAILRRMEELNTKYAQWQGEQQKRADAWANATKTYAKKSRDFMAQRSHVLQNATNKAGKAAEDASRHAHEKDWAWGEREDAHVGITFGNATSAAFHSDEEESNTKENMAEAREELKASDTGVNATTSSTNRTDKDVATVAAQVRRQEAEQKKETVGDGRNHNTTSDKSLAEGTKTNETRNDDTSDLTQQKIHSDNADNEAREAESSPTSALDKIDASASTPVLGTIPAGSPSRADAQNSSEIPAPAPVRAAPQRLQVEDIRQIPMTGHPQNAHVADSHVPGSQSAQDAPPQPSHGTVTQVLAPSVHGAAVARDASAEWQNQETPEQYDDIDEKDAKEDAEDVVTAVEQATEKSVANVDE